MTTPVVPPGMPPLKTPRMSCEAKTRSVWWNTMTTRLPAEWTTDRPDLVVSHRFALNRYTRRDRSPTERATPPGDLQPRSYRTKTGQSGADRAGSFHRLVLTVGATSLSPSSARPGPH